MHDGTGVRWLVSAALAARVLSLGLSVAAQQPSATTADLQAVTEAQISPDGGTVAFIRGQSLWRVPFAGGDPQRLSSESAEYSRPRWSADGRQLAFLSRAIANRGSGPARLLVMPSNGGTARAATDAQTNVMSFEWLPDGRRLAYLGVGVGARRLRIVDLTSGAVRQTASITGTATGFCWSTSRSSVVATVRGPAPAIVRIAALPVTGPARVIATTSNTLSDVACSPDGSMLAWLAGTAGGRGAQAMLVPAIGGPSRLVSAAGSGAPASVSWAANGTLSMMFVMNQETWVDILDVRTGARTTVLPPGFVKMIAAASWSADGTRFAVAGSTADHPAEVFAGSLPLATPRGSDPGGAPPPPVRRITFSN